MEIPLESRVILHSSIPSLYSVYLLFGFFAYLLFANYVISGKVITGLTLSDGTQVHYRCNGLVSLIILVVLLGSSVAMDLLPATVIADRGLELLSTTLIFSFLVSFLLYIGGCKSSSQSSSLRPHVSGNFMHDWWFGVQLNPLFIGVDIKFFFVRAGMIGWLLINLSVLGKMIQDANLSRSMIFYQLFSAIYILDFFFYEEYMTTTWDIIAERLGFMLVFGDLVWIPFTFSIQGWWLLKNKVELTPIAAVLNCAVFIIGYTVFRGANKQKHVFKKNKKVFIWGKPPIVIGGKLLASGYWSAIPYCYPIYLLVLLIWRERRDEGRCAEKYREAWGEYCARVPYRIFPLIY